MDPIAELKQQVNAVNDGLHIRLSQIEAAVSARKWWLLTCGIFFLAGLVIGHGVR